jgi:hypothetical protein
MQVVHHFPPVVVRIGALDGLHADLIVLSVAKGSSRDYHHQIPRTGEPAVDALVPDLSAQFNVVTQRIDNVRVHALDDAARLSRHQGTWREAHDDGASVGTWQCTGRFGPQSLRR